MHDFSKMHGAGNDFIVADERAKKWPRHATFIQNVCDRQRGIGADGLILLSAPSSSQAHIKMSFFNNDGMSAEMCGNGLRCAALFARHHMTSQAEIMFETGAGILRTKVLDKTDVEIEIPLLKNPEKISVDGRDCYFINTGVPHLVVICEDITEIDIECEGCKLRNHPMFQPEGTNVNFITIPNEPSSSPCSIRTYERGVEGETAACGTGIAASALALAYSHKLPSPIKFNTSYSDILKVDFCSNDNMVALFSDIRLIGPAVEVFTGTLNILRSFK